MTPVREKGLRSNRVILPSTGDQPGRKAWAWVKVIKPQETSPTDLAVSRESTLRWCTQGSTLTWGQGEPMWLFQAPSDLAVTWVGPAAVSLSAPDQLSTGQSK